MNHNRKWHFITFSITMKLCIFKKYKEKEKINIGKTYTILLYCIHVFIFIYISEQMCLKNVVV